MVEAWLIELVKGIGKLFLNPVFYWLFLLVIIAGNRRIKKERSNFGIKIFDVFSEWKGTWGTAIISGLLMSLITLGAGFVFNYDTILVLSIVTILLSLLFHFSLLSAVYTLGITYILLLFFLFFTGDQLFPSETNFIGLSLLIGLLLLIEAIMVLRVKRNDSFPGLTLSNRGIWIGEHHLKRLAIIPFFVLIPTGTITPFADYWPYFSIGGETYSLLLVPFIIGFDYLVKGRLPKAASKKISQVLALLAVVVLTIAIGSIWISGLSFVSVFIAILGREYISYRFRVGENKRIPFFHPSNYGLKVLGIIPGTPADKLGILVGETIIKVNGKKISTVDDFYLALHTNTANFKLDVLNDDDEVRFIQGAFYENDHYQLGLIFPSEPYRKKTEDE